MRLFRKLLFPFSVVYALAVHLRNFLYDGGIFKSKSFGTPIISVGNLSVGGTGKTPMIELLVDLLAQDFKIAVLSRGYRRKSRGFVLADSHSTVEALGDEPFQIYTKFPEITVAVDADRRNGISILEDRVRPDVILLDDAFQHRKVKPGLSILLTTYGHLYADDWYLPTGNLRDSKREAKRADLIIVTKCPPNLGTHEKKSIVGKINPKSHQQVLFSHLVYGPQLKGKTKSLDLNQLVNKQVTVVTGIAYPEPLLAHLRKSEIAFDHLRFKDHHYFTEKELKNLEKRALIITTEKDFVRLQHKSENLYFISVKHQFSKNDNEVLEERLRLFMRPSSSRNS